MLKHLQNIKSITLIKEISKNNYVNMLLECFINQINGEKTELKNC
mgnify:CR=1 FL=1